MDTGKNGTNPKKDTVQKLDPLNYLNELAAQATPPNEPLYDLKETAESMARRGFRFTPETLKLTEKFCQGNSGLILRGDVGVGKSFFFYALDVPALSLGLAKGRPLEELNYALDSWQDYDIVIDDVGKGDGEIVSYGTRHELFPYVVEKRMEAAGNTHLTTNLTADELLKRYGTRIVDRLTQLGEMVTLEGPSRRCPGGLRMRRWYEEFFKGRVWWTCARCCKFWDPEGAAVPEGRRSRDAHGPPRRLRGSPPVPVFLRARKDRENAADRHVRKKGVAFWRII